MPNQYSYPIPLLVDVIFPEDISDPAGPGVPGKAEQVSLRGDLGVGSLTSTDGTLAWLDQYDHFVFQVRSGV